MNIFSTEITSMWQLLASRNTGQGAKTQQICKKDGLIISVVSSNGVIIR